MPIIQDLWTTIPSPGACWRTVFFCAGTYAQMFTKFPFYTLDKKSPRFVWFARDFYEFSAWASDSCSFVLKKSSLCRFGDGSCGARLGREMVGWVHVALCKLRG